MDKPIQGGARPGSGRKTKYPNWPGPTELVRLPASALPEIYDLLEKVQNQKEPEPEKVQIQDSWSEYNLILDYLHFLKKEKNAYLCEYFEGYDAGGIQIPQGFLKWAGSHQLAFEEFRGVDLKPPKSN